VSNVQPLVSLFCCCSSYIRWYTVTL
jgi:hypothetical protein